MKNDWYIYFISALLISFVLFLPKSYSADTNTVSSTVTVDKTPPSANSPSINSVNSFICRSGVSGAVQTQILGISAGTTFTEENCIRLKNAKTLYDMGMKVAAVSVMCQDKKVFDAMMMAGTPCPYDGKIGEAAKIGWESHEDKKKHELNGTDKKQDVKQTATWSIGGILAFLLLL